MNTTPTTTNRPPVTERDGPYVGDAVILTSLYGAEWPAVIEGFNSLPNDIVVRWTAASARRWMTATRSGLSHLRSIRARSMTGPSGSTRGVWAPPKYDRATLAEEYEHLRQFGWPDERIADRSSGVRLDSMRKALARAESTTQSTN